MKRVLRVLEIVLVVAGAGLYIAAKIHFFTRYGSDNYFSEHWPYWAGMLAIGLFAGFFDWLSTRFAADRRL